MIRFTLLALATLALFLPAGAEECVPTTSEPEIDTGETGFGRYYVDNDVCQFDGCAFSVWVYQESNGIDGLQRNDEMKDDTCGGMIDSDTLASY